MSEYIDPLDKDICNHAKQNQQLQARIDDLEKEVERLKENNRILYKDSIQERDAVIERLKGALEEYAKTKFLKVTQPPDTFTMMGFSPPTNPQYYAISVLDNLPSSVQAELEARRLKDEALVFYSEETNWKTVFPGSRFESSSKAERDRGQLAREALQKHQGEA